MTMDLRISRRSALVAGAVGAGAFSLAACGAGAGSTALPTAAPSATLVALSSIEVGRAVSTKLADGAKVIVSRPSATTAACFSAICTHMGCTVAPAGDQLHCPCHGSIFNAFTGAVIQGPAPARYQQWPSMSSVATSSPAPRTSPRRAAVCQ